MSTNDSVRDNIPQTSMKVIDRIASLKGTSKEEILQEYLQEYQNSLTINSSMNVEMRHRYVAASLYQSVVSRPSTREYTVIPIGIGKVRTNKKSQKKSCSLLVVAKIDDEITFRKMMLRDSAVSKYKDLTFFWQYSVECGAFQDGTLIADDRTLFEDPQTVSFMNGDVDVQLNESNLLDFFTFIGVTVPEITFSDAHENQSEKTTTGWAIETSIRYIEGFIESSLSGDDKNGDPWGQYRITEWEPTVFQEVDLADGTQIRGKMTVWISPHLMNYSQGSACGFFATIERNEKGEVSANAYMVSPIVVANHDT